MLFGRTSIDGAWSLIRQSHDDERGSFARLFCRDEFAAQGLVGEFVQASISVTKRAGTVRGMHFQRRPYEEVKLVRCVRGAIYDVVADLRVNSPTYMRWESFRLSPEDGLGVYIPAGCAHGFQTLTEDCEVLYHMSAPHAPTHAAGFRFDDPALEIAWPLPVALIAEKDLAWPPLSGKR